MLAHVSSALKGDVVRPASRFGGNQVKLRAPGFSSQLATSVRQLPLTPQRYETSVGFTRLGRRHSKVCCVGPRSV